MGKFEKIEDIKGYIAYWNLSEWWMSEFTQKERIYMNKKYLPIPLGGEIIEGLLAEVEIENNLQANEKGNPASFLINLSWYFNTIKDGNIALRIVYTAEEYLDESMNRMDLHFMYLQLIKVYYRNRHNPEALRRFIYNSNKSIEIAPLVLEYFIEDTFINCLPGNHFIPNHPVYKQFAIFREKEKNYNEAIEICSKALKEGWPGDWEKRIERCKIKKDKNFRNN
jgi:tetratricopeptide (TPR) repeat protein